MVRRQAWANGARILVLFVGIGTIQVDEAAAQSAPAISGLTGALRHGQTVTAYGSRFGSRTTPTALVFEDFSAGKLSPPLVSAGIDRVTNVDNLRTRFSPYNARTDFNVGGGYFGYYASTAPRWYVQYWIKLARNWHWGTTGFSGNDPARANIKFFRLHPASPALYTNLGYTYNGWNPGNTAIRFVETGVAHVYLFSMASVFTLDQWHCVQVEYGESSAVGAADGHIRLWIDGQLRDSFDALITSSAADGAAKNKQPRLIGFYDSWPAPNPAVQNMYAYYSDVYVDTEWARVEIGDASTYAACRHREIQQITAWSDRQLSFRVNQGSFADGTRAYLYIVNPGGVVNQTGLPVAVGLSTAPLPQAPSNVVIR